MRRHIGVLASLVVVAAMLGGSSTAQAQTAGVCVFTGVAGTLSPGEYRFDSRLGLGTAVCAGVVDDPSAPGGTALVPPTPATIVSSGGYDNVFCGTGFAHDADGDASTISAGALSLGGVGDPAGFQIPFVGGAGPLLIGPDGAPNLGNLITGPNPADPSPSIWSNYIGTGLVELTPPLGSCITPGNTFEIRGFLVSAKYQSGADGMLP